MPPTSYPNNVTQGDVYCVANASCDPDWSLPQGELPAVLDCSIVFGEATPYGRRLQVASRNVSSGFDVRVTRGDFALDDGAPTPYGRVLRPFVPIGCKADVGTVRQGDFDESIVLDDRTGFARLAKLVAVPGEETPYGRQIVWRGYHDCDNLLTTDPDPPVSPEFRTDVMYAQLFGTTCAYCPTLFLSADVPCVNCSYPTGFDPCGQGHVANYEDGCQGTQNVGGPTCIPFDADPDNFKIACDINTNPFGFGPHHCEECVHQRNLGFLTQIVLDGTDCLSKIPMRPSINEACAYGCGEFGWELWALNPGTLRIPDVFSDQIRIAIREGPCTFPCDVPPCFNDLNPPGFWESCFPFCSSGPTCCCGNEVFCVGTHEYEWDRDNDGNRLVSAKLCFSQRELCDPGTGNGPCDANPVQDPDDYSNPSSRIIVDVTARVVIKLIFKHWGPTGGGFPGGWGCCQFDFSFDVEPDEIVVTLTGEFCGPIAWGNQEPWTGFRAEQMDRIWPGIQSPNGSQIVSPEAAYVKGACGNLFVDQGRYDDAASFDIDYEVPKRCTTWLGNFEGSPTAVKFWRIPWLRWTWSFTQNPTTSNWGGALAQPNQHQRENQCWAAQPIVNDGTGCQEGTIFNGNVIEQCHDPGCRRGCSMHDDSYPNFLDPCVPVPNKVTPWGCGQGQTVYPP